MQSRAVSAAVNGSASLIIKDGVKDVAAGLDFIAYIDSDGNIRVNGGNSEGQAGNGTVSDSVSWSSVTVKR